MLLGGGEAAWRRRRRCRFRLLGSLFRTRVVAAACNCWWLDRVLIAEQSWERSCGESGMLVVEDHVTRQADVCWVWVFLVDVRGSLCWQAVIRVGAGGKRCGSRVD